MKFELCKRIIKKCILLFKKRRKQGKEENKEKKIQFFYLTLPISKNQIIFEI